MRRPAGFTVIELLVVVAIGATVTMGGARAIGASLISVRLAAASRVMAQTMRETRARALGEGIALDLVFDAPTSTWEERDGNGGTRWSKTLPPPITYGALPALPRVRFGSTGAAENKTITLLAGPATRRIVVNQRGRVRLT
jgi:prepilin-type N-terminal cleavage/methylation domain-containing protein